MFRLNRLFTSSKSAALSVIAMTLLPVLTGCGIGPGPLAAVTFGSVLWLDLALMPVRSLLGALALDIVNTL